VLFRHNERQAEHDSSTGQRNERRTIEVVKR
jgi:hypothetical protein